MMPLGQGAGRGRGFTGWEGARQGLGAARGARQEAAGPARSAPPTFRPPSALLPPCAAPSPLLPPRPPATSKASAAGGWQPGRAHSQSSCAPSPTLDPATSPPRPSRPGAAWLARPIDPGGGRCELGTARVVLTRRPLPPTPFAPRPCLPPAPSAPAAPRRPRPPPRCGRPPGSRTWSQTAAASRGPSPPPPSAAPSSRLPCRPAPLAGGSTSWAASSVPARCVEEPVIFKCNWGSCQ